MRIKLVTDSSADLPETLIDRYKIEVVPLSVIFENEALLDRVQISSKEFFERIEKNKEQAQTSQATPSQFMGIFKEALMHHDEVICVTMASQASGTHQSAHLAKNALEAARVHIIDSSTLSMGTGLLVLEIAEMIEKGIDVETILKESEQIKKRIEVRFLVDSLEHLERGGRIKKSDLILGNLLKVKPILSVEDGVAKPIKKTRSMKKAIKCLSDSVMETPVERISVAHGNNLGAVHGLKEMIERNTNLEKEIIVSEIGATVGCHSGPGIIAVMTLREK